MRTSLPDQKRALRAAMRARRRGLSDAKALAAGQAIGARVAVFISQRNPSAILAYANGQDHEAPTLSWLDNLLRSDRAIFLPVTAPGGALRWGVYTERDRLIAGRHGILEPPAADYLDGPPPSRAIVLVPGIAFDPRGNRLGFGAGYYDRFLAAHRGLRVGLTYDFQVVETVPTEPHDIPMDFLITDTRTLACGKVVDGSPLQ